MVASTVRIRSRKDIIVICTSDVESPLLWGLERMRCSLEEVVSHLKYVNLLFCWQHKNRNTRAYHEQALPQEARRMSDRAHHLRKGCV